MNYREKVATSDVDSMIDLYKERYDFSYSDEEYFYKHTRDQARTEIALEQLLDDIGATAFSTTSHLWGGSNSRLGCKLMVKGTVLV